MDNNIDEEDLLLLTIALLPTKKRLWVHPINKKRVQRGEYHRLCRELECYEDRFFIYFRMSRNSFEDLFNLLNSSITRQTTNLRTPIEPRERLAICLRYIATGDSFQTIAFSFRLGRSTVSAIVKEVCEAIWNILQPIVLPQPTRQTWMQSADGYNRLWGFPNCVGSIDGKHVKIKCPANSGSDYHCYKGFFSVVLLAVVDPNYKFIIVDIGAYGRESDSTIFRESNFYAQYIATNQLPPPKMLPGTYNSVPHVLVGDEGFALQPQLMRPYPRATIVTDSRKKLYNAQLSRARRVVENVFGILTMKWRVFLRPIECKPSTADKIIKAACCLHNYIAEKHSPSPPPTEQENRNETETQTGLITISHTNNRSTQEALEIRETFADYFYTTRYQSTL
uniref:DDE Tnp4 domain-containing protein n=1 Tax=Anopheles albimanus TaxID=7167 RepID=A0A182F8H5_ANOAL